MMKTQKNKIQYITSEYATKLLDLLTDTDSPGENMPYGLFLWKEGGKWIAMDNVDAYAWVEEFSTKHDAEHWLIEC